MIESRFWRQELRADLTWLQRHRRFGRWSEKQQVLFERRLMLVAFQIRVLLERPKVSQKARITSLAANLYKKLGTEPVTLLNAMAFELLHGGPGFNSYYLKPLEALGDQRTVIRYDQLGAGKSGPMTDTTKMTIAHFVAELDSLRSHLGYD
jgi:hypothetical protein